MAEIDDILRVIRLFRRTASDEGFDKLLGALVAALKKAAAGTARQAVAGKPRP
jgi:hypothetical protein